MGLLSLTCASRRTDQTKRIVLRPRRARSLVVVLHRRAPVNSLGAMARCLIGLFTLGALCGCSIGTLAVRRSVLAPLPAMPMAALDTQQPVSLAAQAQVHPFNLATADVDSGVAAPRWQVTAMPMFRINRYVALGGAFELGSGSRAAYPATLQPPVEAEWFCGFKTGVHTTLFQRGIFGLDATTTVSLHLAPVVIGAVSQPLGSQQVIAKGVGVIPGIAGALLPRLTGRWGTVFAGISAASTAYVERQGVVSVDARGAPLNFGGVGGVAGVADAPLVMAGAGYAKVFSNGVGVTAQVWAPVTERPVGYRPMFGLSLSYAWQPAPAADVAGVVPPQKPTTSSAGLESL